MPKRSKEETARILKKARAIVKKGKKEKKKKCISWTWAGCSRYYQKK